MQQFHTKGRENSGNYACFPPFHEPFPLIPSFSPSGGEGARRAVEGDSDRFMASIHVRILEVSPTHEPSSPPLQPFVAYATKGCRHRFLASMRDFEIVGATHEPYPIIPSFFPRGGEGAWRAVEGNSDWFMARFTSEFWRRSLP